MADHDSARMRAPLLERESELALLHRLQRAAGGADGRVVVVEGRAGMGKSSLLAAARLRAEDAGFLVLSARGSDLESTYAFGVVRQLFETRLAASPTWLQGSAASALSAFGTGTEVAGPGSFDDVSLAVLHGLYWLTVNACSDRPVALLVDDAQWSDLPSLRFLAYLAARVERMRLLVLVGVRTGDRVAASVLVSAISQEPSTVTVELQPSTADGVSTVLETRLGAEPDRAFAAACHQATDGNPLLLNELVRTMRTEGIRPDTAPIGVVADLSPRAVSRTVLMRFARLDAEAVELARAVAVLGEGGDLLILSGLTGMSAPCGWSVTWGWRSRWRTSLRPPRPTWRRPTEPRATPPPVLTSPRLWRAC